MGGTNDDGAYFIVQTSDGGYAITGYTNSFGAGASDFYIVKLDYNGNLQWNRAVGGSGEDVAIAMIQSTDGGYAAAGYTNSFGAGNRDYYVVKLDSNGVLQWNRTLGGTGYDFAETIIQTSDGGYAIAGFTYSFGAGSGDFYIVKLDTGGTVQWSKTIGGTDDDYCLAIIQTREGGYAVAGPSSSYGAGNNDFYIVKLTANGTIQWTRTVGGTGLDYAESIIQTIDGGYAVGGLTYSFGSGNKDMLVVKLDSTGILQWTRTAGGTNEDYAESIVQAGDGGFVGAGHTSSYGAGSFDAYIVKFDASGNTCINSTTPLPVTSSGGIAGNPPTIINSPVPSVISPSSPVVPNGILTTICLVGIHSISNKSAENFKLFQNYPNPFNPVTFIKFEIPNSKPGTNSKTKIRIYDALGKEVSVLVNQQLKFGIYEVEWDGSNYPSGIYYYRLETNDFSETRKMILIK